MSEHGQAVQNISDDETAEQYSNPVIPQEQSMNQSAAVAGSDDPMNSGAHNPTVFSATSTYAIELATPLLSYLRRRRIIALHCNNSQAPRYHGSDNRRSHDERCSPYDSIWKQYLQRLYLSSARRTQYVMSLSCSFFLRSSVLLS